MIEKLYGFSISDYVCLVGFVAVTVGSYLIIHAKRQNKRDAETSNQGKRLSNHGLTSRLHKKSFDNRELR